VAAQRLQGGDGGVPLNQRRIGFLRAAFNPTLPPLQGALNLLSLNGYDYPDIQRAILAEKAKRVPSFSSSATPEGEWLYGAWQRLAASIAACVRAANRCHAPYSHSPSGVALELKDGTLFSGSYAENSPLTGKPWSWWSISRVLISRSFGPKASGR
jgi:hypothetical protein